MDILKLLKSDHKELQAYCDKMQATSENAQKTRQELFEYFSALLSAHAKAEEAALYEKVKKFDNVHKRILESLEEHHVADMLLQEVADTNPTDERWMAKIAVLSNALDDHIKEEEEVLFPKVKRLLSQDELEKCGEKFTEHKILVLEKSPLSQIRKEPGANPPVFRP